MFEVYFCPRFQNLILSRQASKSVFTRALKRHYVLVVISPTSARPDSFINTDNYGLKGTPKLSRGEAVRLERNVRRSAN